MASYSYSLLVALKPNRTAYSILSPVGEVNCRPMPSSVCLEAPSTQCVHQPVLSRHVFGCGIYEMKSANTCPFFEFLTCTGCHTLLTPLLNGSSFRSNQVYGFCLGVEDQLAPQRDEPGSMGGAFGRLSEGPRQLVRGGYIWSPRRLRIC